MGSSKKNHRKRKDRLVQDNDIDDVEIQSVLRIRPLIKRENVDQVVLEPVHRLDEGGAPTVVLHPIMSMRKQQPTAPGMKMLSPETLQLCKDSKYHMDHLFPAEADQEKIYHSLGLPMARAAMEYLKAGPASTYKHTNILISMGSSASGKTFTCFGDMQKRRPSPDGLLPRIAESFFSQSKHHIKKEKQRLTFGVRTSVIQLVEHQGEQKIYDLLSPSLAKNAARSPLRSPSPARAIKSVKKIVATLERTARPHGSAAAVPEKYDSGLLNIHQDPETEDFLVHADVRLCNETSSCRDVLLAATAASQKLSSNEAIGHMLTVLQPVLINSSGMIHKEGGRVLVLDMSAMNATQRKRNTSQTRRDRDTVGSSSQGNDALSAIQQCVRSLTHNSMIRKGKKPALDFADGLQDDLIIDDVVSEISCVSQEKSLPKGPTTKVVPFRHHKMTMLLQPYISSPRTPSAQLTLLLAAYPGHRDYTEKKALLNEFDLLFEIQRDREAQLETGLMEHPLPPIPLSPSSEGSSSYIEQESPPPSKKKRSKRPPLSPMKTEPIHIPKVTFSASLDDGDDDIPRPPPFAPSAPPLSALSPAMPPPIEAPKLSTPPVVDFPGVVLPSSLAPPTETPESKRETVKASTTGGPMAMDFHSPPLGSPPQYGGSQYGGRGHPLQDSTSHNVLREPSSGGSDLDCGPLKQLMDPPKMNRLILERDYVKNKRNQIHDENNGEENSATEKEAAVQSLSQPRAMQASSSHTEKHLSAAQPTTEVENGTCNDVVVACVVSEKVEKKNRKASNLTEHHATERLKAFAVASESKDVGVHLKKKVIPGMSSKERVANHHQSSAVSMRGKDKSPKKQAKQEKALIQRLKSLEAENQDLQKTTRGLAQHCDRLERKNSDLKQSFEETKKRSRIPKWTPHDERAWNEGKKQRLESQRLICRPVWDHIEDVNKTFGNNGRWNFAIGKGQFQLRMPPNFQRASALDQRDKNDDDTGSGSVGLQVPSTFDSIQKLHVRTRRRKSSLYKMSHDAMDDDIAPS